MRFEVTKSESSSPGRPVPQCFFLTWPGLLSGYFTQPSYFCLVLLSSRLLRHFLLRCKPILSWDIGASEWEGTQLTTSETLPPPHGTPLELTPTLPVPPPFACDQFHVRHIDSCLGCECPKSTRLDAKLMHVRLGVHFPTAMDQA